MIIDVRVRVSLHTVVLPNRAAKTGSSLERDRIEALDQLSARTWKPQSTSNRYSHMNGHDFGALTRPHACIAARTERYASLNGGTSVGLRNDERLPSTNFSRSLMLSVRARFLHCIRSQSHSRIAHDELKPRPMLRAVST